MEIEERFFSKVRKSDGCWQWLAVTNPRGYGQFRVGDSMKQAHRVSWELSNGPIDDGLCVCHRCDIPACVNPDHLFLGTVAENMADRDKKNRQADRRGSLNGRAKLSELDVRFIRHWFHHYGATRKELAELFGVAHSGIVRLISGKSWAHVQ